MKLGSVLSAAKSIPSNILNYLQRRRKQRLYQQWVERAGLPPEVVPDKADESEDVHAQIHKRKAVGHKASGPVRVLPGSSAVTDVEVTGDMMAEINKRQARLPLLYVLVGASLVILCVGLILLILYSC